ncbi:MAG: hypothetical protein II248_01595 [Paludibacteraceae bacterium]|nr:hypothetical protein [Paludibacteraceae bacterium]
MKAKILTLLTFMVMTCMSLTSMAQEPILILVEENGNEVTQPSQESSFSFPQEETTTTTTTTEPSSFNSSVTHLEEEVLTLTFEDEDASAAKAAEEARRAEEARLAEEARRAEEARLAEEARRAEEARLAEEARRAEEARLAEEARRAEEARLAEEARRAEEARLAEEARRAEEARLAEEARRAEEARLAEEARRAEEARLAEEARRAEEAHLAEEARRAEEARLAEEARRAEEARLAEEARRAEEARLAKEKAAAQTEQVKPTQPTTEEQNLEERVATAVAAEARALEAAAKAEEAAKKATEEREKIEALQNAQGMPAQTEQQVQPTAQLPKAVQDLEAATDTVPAKQTVRERYYKKSGTNFLSIVSVGYSTVFLTPNRMDGLTHTEFAGKRHFINFEILEWRAKLFGMQLFNFEIGVNTPGWTEGGTNLTKLMSGGEYNKIGYGSGLKEADARTMWFAYKPAIKLYIPCSDWLAIELYGGMEIDLTTAWSKINPLYYRYNKDIPGLNYFLGAYGGLGLMLTPAPAVPIEIKAEYRHPVQGNMDIVPQGFYLSTQLHLGVPIRKTHKNKK